MMLAIADGIKLWRKKASIDFNGSLALGSIRHKMLFNCNIIRAHRKIPLGRIRKLCIGLVEISYANCILHWQIFVTVKMAKCWFFNFFKPLFESNVVWKIGAIERISVTSINIWNSLNIYSSWKKGIRDKCAHWAFLHFRFCRHKRWFRWPIFWIQNFVLKKCMDWTKYHLKGF